MKRFRFEDGGDIVEDIRHKYGFDGDLVEIYATNPGPTVHKWHHYLPLYDRYFSRFRGSAVRFLEVGVNKGGSLQVWRKYLGEDAVIFGIDIRESCAELDGQAGRVRIGSQDDPDFLDSVVSEMGGVDVVLDDGSHQMPHVRKTFEHLFPKLAEGGIYMVEDLHTAYLRRFGGGLTRNSNFFAFVRELTDDLHHWYHRGEPKYPDLSAELGGIHVHDSIAVFEKQKVHKPVHSWVGDAR